jgi:hypothetical protein
MRINASQLGNTNLDGSKLICNNDLHLSIITIWHLSNRKLHLRSVQSAFFLHLALAILEMWLWLWYSHLLIHIIRLRRMSRESALVILRQTFTIDQ